MQIHDEAGAVGDTCNITADGHVPIDGGTLVVDIDDGEIRQTYNVAGHTHGYTPDSTRIRGRKSVDQAALRTTAAATVASDTVPRAISVLANSLGDVSSSVLHAGARAAIADASTYNEFARALELYGLFITETGTLASLPQITGFVNSWGSD